MIGGKFDPNNRFNYGMQSRRQPGSSFKPLVYSAALDSGMFTAATVLVDKPYVFTFDSDDPDDWYRPENYGGYYYGKVSLRRALRKSLNIPACQIFYTIGKNNRFKFPIDRAAILLGLNSQSEIDQRFKPEISTVLGTGSVSPIEMAMAFSVFANGGKRRVANSILYIEDRDGRIIYESWKDLEKYYRENSKKLQVITKENAFLVTNILRDTVHNPEGFLAGYKSNIIKDGKTFPDVELAAKTGTTQNWSDAWEVGYSPEITVAMWAGFDKYGLSLGYEQAGVNVLGRHFLEYMRQYHLGKGKLVFANPGVGGVKVCKESGLLPSKDCKDESIYFEYFLPGTYPKTECNICGQKKDLEENVMDKFRDIYDKKFGNDGLYNYKDLNLDIDKSVIDMFKTKEEIINFDKLDFDKTTTTLDDINSEDKEEIKLNNLDSSND